MSKSCASWTNIQNFSLTPLALLLSVGLNRTYSPEFDIIEIRLKDYCLEIKPRMVGTQKFTQVMTIEEIRQTYPNQWVIIADTESDEDFNIIKGQVLAHSPERDQIDQALMDYTQMTSLAIEYTGSIPEDYAIML